MRTVVHLSDLHFGRADSAVAEVLAAEIKLRSPDMIAVSGDLTQRARTREFELARDFLKLLPFSKVVVPGNHDVPLDDVISRFRSPLEKYRRYITDDLAPFYADDEVAVVGINTARSLTWKNGRINRQQIEASCGRLGQYGAEVTRIIVTHHPFDLPANARPHHLVGRARMAMIAFAECKVDMFLSGHLHVSSITRTLGRYQMPGHSALVIQAGTAISSRRRGEVNSWNLLRIERRHVSIERFIWSPEASSFASGGAECFRKTNHGWLSSQEVCEHGSGQRPA